MSRNTKNMGVRMAMEGGGKFKADMRGIGQTGQNSLRKIEKSARDATPELLVMNKAAGGLNNILRQGAGLLTAYLSVSTLLSSVSQFAIFEQGLVGVGKTTNIVGAELQSLGDEIDAMTRRIPVASAGLLDIAESAGQLGVQGSQNILLFTATMAKMESATDLVGSEGAKSLQRILNVTGEATDNIDNLSSAIVALGNSMAASESEIVGQAREIAAAGAVYGITSEQAAGLGAATAAMGIQAELAGSTAARAFLAIDDAIAKGGDKIRVLSELTGIAAEDLQQAFGDNAVQVFEKFLGGLNRVDKSGGRISETLATFGLNSVRVLKTLPVMALRVDDVTTALALSNKEFDRNVALTEEATRAWDTTQSAGQVLANTLSSLSRGFAEGFNAELRQSTKDVQNLVEETIPASRELGENFAPAVAFASKSLVTLVENGGTVIKVLGGLVIARSAAAAIGLLSTSLVGNAGAIIGLRAMIAVSPVAAAQMVATAGAARILSGSLALIGGPIGAAVLAAGGLYLLATRENQAAKIAREHTEIMGQEISRLRDLTTASDDYNRSLSNREDLRIADMRATVNAEISDNREFLKGQGTRSFFLKQRGNTSPQESFEGAFAANRILNDLNKVFHDGDITITEYADSLSGLALNYDGAREKIMPMIQALELIEKKMERLRELDAAGLFGASIPIRDKPLRASDEDGTPANDNKLPALSFAENAALANVKVISQTVAQYEKARESITSTLAKMEIDSFRATGNITAAIRREADTQIAIWKQRAIDFPAIEQDMFRAITLINEQAARDVEEFRQQTDKGLQAGKDAAQTFTESLIAAGATSGSVLDQLGRSFRTTMLKMVSDAFLLKPIQSIFGSIFSSIASFLPGSFGGGGIGQPSAGLFDGGFAGPGNFAALPSANGNVFQGGGIIPFARGGIVDRPQYFPMAGGRTGLMGEAGPEAIMPLSRGRDGKLGVKSSGSSPVVNVNIIGAPAGTQTRERQRSDGGIDIDVIIPRAVAGDILGGGDVSDALETRYGLVAGGV